MFKTDALSASLRQSAEIYMHNWCYYSKQKNMKTEKLDKLFQEYENAFSHLDFRKIAQFYSDSFISAGPKGAISQNKQDFLKKAEEAAGFYRSVGMTSAKMLSKKEIPISDDYTVVTTHWAATFKKTADKSIEFDVSYLVHLTNDEPEILMSIAHEDELEAMKRLELIPQEAGE